jgi:hypothetical protein
MTTNEPDTNILGIALCSCHFTEHDTAGVGIHCIARVGSSSAAYIQSCSVKRSREPGGRKPSIG